MPNNNDREGFDPTRTVESQLPKAGETPPVKDQYADSPASTTPVTSTHDRDSAQPPDPNGPVSRSAPEMPLKEKQ